MAGVRGEQCDFVWSPIESASSYAQLSGFMVTAVLVVIGVGLQRDSAARRGPAGVDALGLVGLISMLYAAFEYTVIVGESACFRALSANMRVGTILAFGAMSVIAALVSYWAEGREASLGAMRAVVWGIAFIAGSRLWAAVHDASQSLDRRSLTFNVVTAMVAALLVVSSALLPRWRSSVASTERSGPSVRHLYAVMLVLFVVNVAMTAIENERTSVAQWSDPDASGGYVYASMAYVMIGLVGIGRVVWIARFHLRKVDREKVSEPAQSEGPPGGWKGGALVLVAALLFSRLRDLVQRRR